MGEAGIDRLYEDALRRFDEQFAEACSAQIREPTAMTLATARADGRPQARTVLLKQHDSRGFVFYTNLGSRKGLALAYNPQAALLFFWQPLMRQVKIEGGVEPVDETEADDYWFSRPRESRLGAWASEQSAVLASRDAYEARLAELRARYGEDREIPRPAFWSGFRVVPDRIEFWHERAFRQHDRDCYWWSEAEGWQWSLLNP